MQIGHKLGALLWCAAATFAPCAIAKSAEPVRPVPLGGQIADQSGDQFFGIYIPTKFGGTLTLETTEGTVEKLTGPDGKPRRNGEDLGSEHAHGWYTFQVVGAKSPYTVRSTFQQLAESVRRPWNFYYWPTKGDSIHEPWAGGNGRVDTSFVQGDDYLVASTGSHIKPGEDIVRPGSNGILETRPAPGDTSTWFPNMYDDLSYMGADGVLYATPSPMLKYDQIFNTSARAFEAARTQNQDIRRWPGHCLGGAVASIALNEPTPAPGSGMSRDELKALWAELGENHFNHQIGDNVNNIPAGPPRPGYDPTDWSVPRFHNMIETHIRGRKRALLANLRAFPPNGTSDEVWNHGVGKYTAKMSAVPGKGERVMRVKLELVANTGANLNEGDNKPRVNLYEYIVIYNANGQADESQQNGCDWISCGGEAVFCPLNVMDVVTSRWAGHNQFVTEQNVRSLDLANGGQAVGWLAGPPRQFRPITSSEGLGRASMFAAGSPDPRGEGGLFSNGTRGGRVFGRRLFGR
jgi:hypothetical protein